MNEPERNRCKTADGWSFPARAASPPRRSFRSSSRKPFGATDDHVTHTHTHTTQHHLKRKLSAATRTGRKCRSGPDISLRINAKAHRLSRAQVPRRRPFSVMESMSTCAEVDRRPTKTPVVIFRLRCEAKPGGGGGFQHKWWGATHSGLSKHTNAGGLMLDVHAGVRPRTPSRCRKHNARVRKFPP